MTEIATWVIRVAVMFATLSVVANLVVAHRLRSMLFAGIAALSVVYVTGYLWLLLNPTERAVWSEVMSGVSLVAWPMVWIGPAVRTFHQRTRFEKALTNMAATGPKVSA